LKSFRRSHINKISILFFLVGIIIIVLLIFIFIENNINPAVITFSEASIQSIAQTAMNDSIKQVLGSSIKYTDLVNVLTDKNGNVAMVQANTTTMNSLATQTSQLVQEKVKSMGNENIQIPLGTIFGSKLLAGWGPNIRIRVISFPSVSTDFDSEFEDSGINQTRHKIYMVMQAKVRIAIPFGTADIDISNRVPVTETIIVGDVPNSYVNVDNTEDMLNLIPTE
jgi:sporulation protein YunB